MATPSDSLLLAGLEPTAAGSRPALRILMVEDTVINRKVFAVMLRQMGHVIDEAGDGVEALEAVRRSRYDVVFMDLSMPRMGGIEATRRILAETPESARPYIVALTAHVTASEEERCRDAGMNAFLRKPVTKEHFEVVLAHAAQRAEG